MYRIAFLLVPALAILLGLLVGTLNPAAVQLDLLWIRIEWPLGLVLLTAAVTGLLLGLLLAWLFSVLPLKARLRRAGRRAEGQSPSGSLTGPND